MDRLHQGVFVLEGSYEVYQGTKPVGKVQLVKQGLYCRIQCRCRPEGQQVHRLYVLSDTGRENLGVVVPEGDGFVLDKCVPAKRLGSGKPEFQLLCGGGAREGVFIPICPEEPFQYIQRLKDAFLESENGKVGVRILEKPGAK